MEFEFRFFCFFSKKEIIFVQKCIFHVCAFVFVKTFQEEFRSVNIVYTSKVLSYIYIFKCLNVS